MSGDQLDLDARPCRHCGRGPDPDGDHSCPCPHPDESCPDHNLDVTMDRALALWEDKGPTSLTVALVVDALYEARAEVRRLRDREAQLVQTCESYAHDVRFLLDPRAPTAFDDATDLDVIAAGTPLDGPPRCPECTSGKHQNCDGTTWDDAADTPTDCPCAEGGHQ